MSSITTTDYGAAIIAAQLAYISGAVSILPVVTAVETGHYAFIVAYGFMCITAIIGCTVFAIEMYLTNVRGYSQLDLPVF